MAGWESLEAVLKVVDAFEELEIPYHVGGSLASSLHGMPRQTNDLDIVADLRLSAAAPLVLRLHESSECKTCSNALSRRREAMSFGDAMNPWFAKAVVLR